MRLQHKRNYKNTNMCTDLVKLVKACCKPKTNDWAKLGMGEEGFLDVVDVAKPEGRISGTPRLANWALLDLTKRTLHEADNRFFKHTFGDAVKPIMTDPDPMEWHTY